MPSQHNNTSNSNARGRLFTMLWGTFKENYDLTLTTGIATIEEGIFSEAVCVQEYAIADVVVADSGTATTTEFTLGSNAGVADDLIASIDGQVVDETSGLVFRFATGDDLLLQVTVTGVGQTLADISDDTQIEIMVSFIDNMYVIN